jgi:hypothetical protein
MKWPSTRRSRPHTWLVTTSRRVSDRDSYRARLVFNGKLKWSRHVSRVGSMEEDLLFCNQSGESSVERRRVRWRSLFLSASVKERDGMSISHVDIAVCIISPRRTENLLAIAMLVCHGPQHRGAAGMCWLRMGVSCRV